MKQEIMNKVLRTERLVLKPLSEQDLFYIVLNMNDLHIACNLEGVGFPYQKEDALEWIERCKDSDSNVLCWGMHELSLGNEEIYTQELIGEIALNPFNARKKSGDLMYWMNKKFRRRGLMQEGMTEAQRFLMKEKGFSEIRGSVFEDNFPSRELLKKLGFRESGPFEIYNPKADLTGKNRKEYHYILKRDF